MDESLNIHAPYKDQGWKKPGVRFLTYMTIPWDTPVLIKHIQHHFEPMMSALLRENSNEDEMIKYEYVHMNYGHRPGENCEG